MRSTRVTKVRGSVVKDEEMDNAGKKIQIYCVYIVLMEVENFLERKTAQRKRDRRKLITRESEVGKEGMN